jgi:hypothetical protein
MKLNLGQGLTSFSYGNMPRRIASEEEVLAVLAKKAIAQA